MERYLGGAGKTLADYVKESAWQTGGNTTQTIGILNNTIFATTTTTTNATTLMPWAAAVKSPPDQQQQLHHQLQQHHQQQQQQTAGNSFNYQTSTIGSWISPETSSSTGRGGCGGGGHWNTDGTCNGQFDDGTAIWGNPTTKKAGIDWAAKESAATANQQASTQGNSIGLEKKTQKTEPIISSINGTEAWGAPHPSRTPTNTETTNNSKGGLINRQFQNSKNNDTSGNIIYGNTASNKLTTIPVVNGSLSWGESSSLQQATEISSPPINCSNIWNNLGISNKQQQKSSDWLSSSTNGATTASARLDELNKQLESTSLFDMPISSSLLAAKDISKTSNFNHQLGLGITSGSGGVIGGVIGSKVNGNSGNSLIEVGNNLNDLKQMSANYSNTDVLDSPANNSSNNNNRQQANNQQSQQFESASSSSSSPPSNAYSANLTTPSRDILKQMVHQIQLAVQAGHLNAHILNQPMSTPTLQLVYQLLQQIKTLHQLQEIQQRAGIKSDQNSPTNMDLQINRIRQNITLLQKAITQQQATLSIAANNNSNKNTDTIGDSNQSNNDSSERSFDSTSTFASSIVGGLSMQSNPWMFGAASSSPSSTASASGIDNIKNGVGGNLNSSNRMDNGNTDKMSGDSLFFKTASTPANSAGTMQRSSSALYDWGDLTSSSSSSLQFNAGDAVNHLNKPPSSSSSLGSGGGRPAPPPGLLSSFGPLIGQQQQQQQQLNGQNRDEILSSASLWSGNWF